MLKEQDKINSYSTTILQLMSRVTLKLHPSHKVTCLFQFLLNIELSRLRLTKLVTVLPYFVIVNKSTHHLRFMEDNEEADLWNDSAPNDVSKHEHSSFCSHSLLTHLALTSGKEKGVTS